MAEHDERDEDVSRRYREMPRDEPPAALDAVVRAHARRAVATRSARPWYFSLAAAAVLVLAVALTWNVEREAPDMVAVAPAPQSPPVAAPPPAPAPQPRVLMHERQERAADAAKPAEPPRPAAPKRAVEEAELAKESRREAATAAAPAMRAQAFSETPEQWLERIARLRAEGKHDEADKALAEFRKRYPDFRIPPETLEKVEKK